MRMHTIPQNVTAYEDKIVGMLIGRQFIYLAIAGVTIFVLMSAQVGPLLIRLFLSILIAAFAAAMALYKPDDRNFDALFMSYIYAMFGPTEWTWQKDILPMSALKAITADFHTSVRRDDAPKKGTAQSRNLQRVSRYQSFISQKEDPSEIDDDVLFIEHLNFSEPIPDRALAAADSNKPAPPMLTKNNYAQTVAAPTAKPKPVQFPQPTPISPIAGSSQAGITFSYNGKQQSISKRSNQRTNRSLSRPLLSNGVLPLPIRGEMKVQISTDLKETLTSVQPAPPPAAQPVDVDLTGQVKQQTAPVVEDVEPTAQPDQKDSAEVADGSNYYEEVGKPTTIRQQINTLGQSMVYSGITTTKEPAMSDTNLPPTTSDDPVGDSTTPQSTDNNQEDTVTVIPQPALGPSNATPDIEEQLHQAERDIQQQVSSAPPLTETTPTEPTAPTSPYAANTPITPPESPTPSGDKDTNTLLLDNYKREIDRLIAYNKEVEARARQAEEALMQMQQTAPSHGQVSEQQNLVNKLRTEQQQTAAYAQELQQKLAGSEPDTEHTHTEYSPVPEVPPVVPASDVHAEAAPMPEVAPTEPAVPVSDQGQDLQARMSAAGVAPADPTPASTPSSSSAAAGSQSSSIALTNEPNIINGRVVDAQGQSLSGVIVVVKNAQGESKRALKTNKLGQFVITTPLTNGSYTVEVDKKGLSFDIINVELNGSVSPPVVISAK